MLANHNAPNMVGTTYPPDLFTRYAELPRSSDLGLLGEVIAGAEESVQAPYAAILIVALAAASTITQPLCNVERTVGGVTSLSLYTFLIAGSGERKSSLIRYFFKPIQEAEASAAREYEVQLNQWKNDFHLWDLHRRAIEKALNKAVQKSLSCTTQKDNPHNNVEVSKARDLLTAHLTQEPLKPRKTQFLYENTTHQALLQGMHEHNNNVCVLADEGAETLNRLISPGMATFNSAWSGMPIIVGRKTSDSFTIRDPRLSFLICIQPGPFKDYREQGSDRAKASGLWPRTMVCGPHSTIGYRPITPAGHNHSDTTNYHRRVKKLLNKSLQFKRNSDQVKPILKFNGPAGELNLQLANEIEINMRPGGLYENATDHASKLMENITRVAAILHVINGSEGDISWETLNKATAICVFYSKEYMTIFNEQPKNVTDAMILNDWFTVNVRNMGNRLIGKRYTRQHCSGALRKPGIFQEALEYLECHGYIKVYQDNSRTWIIDTLPYLPQYTTHMPLT